MVYNLAYRRPQYVDSARQSLSDSTRTRSSGSSAIGSSGSSSVYGGIPAALSFDRIVNGGTCPPCTTRDFMNYLIYIERAAENLQFFLWYKDYCKRFEALSASEKALAPLWSGDLVDPDPPKTAVQQAMTCNDISATAAGIFKDTNFAPPSASIVEVTQNPFEALPRMSTNESASSLQAPSEAGWSENASTLNLGRATKNLHRKQAAAAFEGADVKWQPFTIQPFREEVTRIISIYIADGGSRQLNLSSKEKTAVLHALANTTHPSAFDRVAETVEWSLRRQAHPNFVRWAICNGNRPRVIFARGLGVAMILIGLVIGILLTLSSAGRAWRILALAPLLLGISTLFAAWKGMCVVLHGLHHRHLRPWELFSSEDDASTIEDMEMAKGSFDTLESSTSFESEPWVAKYEKRNIIRKVFDRQVWIQEPALRQIQDTIFLQSLLSSALISAAIVGILCGIPKGKLY